jgi:FtsZ-binding cell division protein ZapB
MSEKRTTLVMMLRDEVSSIAGHIDKTLNSTHKTAMGSVLAGVGLGAGIGAFGLLQSAVGNVGQALGDSIKAAADEETSLAKLDTAIRANVRGWDGNRGAIEKVIAERLKLGFSDDEQRDSLSLLVAKTGDVTEALDIQRAAMDLARLKGIGLAEASKAIALGMSGSGRALKELGINVAEMTDKTQVLGAIQEKAGGQAKAYSETTSGAMLSMQVAIDEASEAIGEKFLPIMKDVAFFVRDNVIPAVEVLSSTIGFLGDIANPAGAQMDAMRQKMADEAAAADAAGKAVATAALTWDTMSEKSAAAREPMRLAREGIVGINDAAIFTVVEVRKLEQSFRDAAQTARDNKLDEAWDIRNLPLKIRIAKEDIRLAQKELEDAKTNEQKLAAELRLSNARQELESLVNQAGDFEDKYGAKGLALGRALGSKLYGQVVAWNLLTKAELAALGDVEVDVRFGGGGGKDAKPKAAGGPVNRGGAYIVGERGPELFVPGSSGTIIPNGGGGGGSPAGGGTVNLNVTVSGAALFDPYGQAAQQIAAALLPGLKREVTRQGVTLA